MILFQVAVDNANGLSLLVQHTVALEQRLEWYGWAIAVVAIAVLLAWWDSWRNRLRCPYACVSCKQYEREVKGLDDEAAITH